MKERLTLNADSDGRQLSVNGGDDPNKVPRLPRWTRQEILVLIQGKKVAENRIRRGRTDSLDIGLEPKWASVSSYCKRHGVNRGPVQCRKRWSNLAGDFKKIKEWESQIKEETESFWVMRNDLRREKKLPGFFDREVYDILDCGNTEQVLLALGSSEILFDSGKSAAVMEDDGLFSDEAAAALDLPLTKEEQEEVEEASAAPTTSLPAPTASLPPPAPLSEQQYQPFSQGCPAPAGTRRHEYDIENAQERKKRKHSNDSDLDDEGASNLTHHLIRVLERNGKMVSSHLEAQNVHFQQDREQQKNHVDCLVSVLNKLADALGRIADKL